MLYCYIRDHDTAPTPDDVEIRDSAMASQYSVDIPFATSHAQQSFKLIELTPELLAALESDTRPTLTVTSSSSASSPSSRAPGVALLEAGSHGVYQMRQKSTSNPIMLLRPSATGPAAADDAAAVVPVPSVCSIARTEDTIELIPYEARGADAGLPRVNKWHEKFAKSRPGAK